MQQTKLLDKYSLEILEKAKKHAMKNFRENVTSIACILKTKDGNYYTGINIKYNNVWKCICAERIAIAKAVENNDLHLKLIVSVKYFPKTHSYEVVNMCGECLQIAINYPSLKVIVNDKGLLKTVSIKDVFPFPYI
jgi:cytidine deaminase